MTNFIKNNLGQSSSPYLQQHKDNPINWQEWNKETLDYAKNKNKLIFLSIGYSTCHWCHVMAKEAFSDHDTANYLNNHFVSIKVDREQRPEIDSFFMDFINKTHGRGGWPLTVVLNPDLKPFFAGTYFPHKEKHGLRPLIYVLQVVKKWYMENQNNLPDYSMQHSNVSFENINTLEIIKKIGIAFDHEFGGFGKQTKFPPHNTLLLLLNFYQETKDESAQEMIITTLDKMSDKGLHDHLQGGFYRYCVDREWLIPHFEKMLYDQAMLLWIYSLSFKIFQREKDNLVIEKIIQNLNETFSNENGLFYSAHDADTNHKEGDTYTWTTTELKKILSKKEYALFSKIYQISQDGNFEGKNHLIKHDLPDIEKNNKKIQLEILKIEEKLLVERNKKVQPFTDKKILTSWNALIGIGLLIAYRYTGKYSYKEMSVNLFEKLIERHFSNKVLAHSSLDNELQSQEFLEDYSVMLLFTTYLFEEDDFENKGQNKYKNYLKIFLKRLNKFRSDANGTEKWYANISQLDFKQVPASMFDHPTPSSKSLAEMAIFRSNMILGKKIRELEYHSFLGSDFHNLTAYYSKGKFHEIHLPKKIEHKDLPINSIIKKGEKYQDCTDFTCNIYKNEVDLISNLMKR